MAHGPKWGTNGPKLVFWAIFRHFGSRAIFFFRPISILGFWPVFHSMPALWSRKNSLTTEDLV